MLFFFNATATTEIYTLSLHDALPIWLEVLGDVAAIVRQGPEKPRSDVVERDVVVAGDDELWLRKSREVVPSLPELGRPRPLDRKSTRLNSSHSQISYAVFCLKKKKKK